MDFWTIIEDSWAISAFHKELRKNFVTIQIDKETLKLGRVLEKCVRNEIYPEIERRLMKVPKDGFEKFLGELKLNLSKLNSPEIYSNAQGSDDRFLYTRSFIIVLGYEYFELVMNNPSIIFPELLFDGFSTHLLYLFDQLYSTNSYAVDSEIQALIEFEDNTKPDESSQGLGSFLGTRGMTIRRDKYGK